METKTTVTYAYPPQHQIVTPQTQVVSVRELSTYGTEKSVALGAAEIILRIICLVSKPCVQFEVCMYVN